MFPASRSQIDKLGERLRKADAIALDDLRLLQAVISAHAQPLRFVQEAIHDELRLVATPRLKTSDTIIDKLRRERGRLSTIQDIAGCRLSPAGDLRDQDQTVAELAALFRDVKVVDRRAAPSHGYRAVHVIVPVRELQVEVQVRTARQDQWAQLMESLADRWGRDVRYGGPPEGPDIVVAHAGTDHPITRGEIVDIMMMLSVATAEIEESALRVDAIYQAEDWLQQEWELDDLTPDEAAYVTELTEVDAAQARMEAELEELLSVLAELADNP